MNKFNTTFRLGLQRSSTDKMSLYKCKCGGCNKGWWSSCANSFLSHSLTAGCFFPHCLGLQAVPSSYVWCLGCSAPLFQVSPSPPLAPLSLSLCPPPRPTLGQTINGYAGIFQLRPSHSVVLGLVRDPHMLRSHNR